jgi:hypothetical protein
MLLSIQLGGHVMSHHRFKIVALLSITTLLIAGAVAQAADPQFNRAVRIIVP